MNHVFLFLLMLVVHGAVLRAGVPQQLPADRSYIENKGQIGDQDGKPNPDVRFLIVRPGLNIQLRTNGFSYDSYVVDRCELTPDDADRMLPPLRRDRPNDVVTYTFHRVDIELVDANPAPVITSRETSADYLNYFTHITEQANGEQGATSVRGYGCVTYHNVWPGIDLEWFLDDEGNPEYQFMVRPGGDPDRIRLRYKGANATELRDDAIMIHVDHGPIREHIPKSFYAGSGLPVDVRYREVGYNTYGVVVPSVVMATAITETLVIDPTPERLWGTYYGGTDEDFTYALTASGDDIMLAGLTRSASAIASTGAFKQTSDVYYGECFLAVLTMSGVRRWATYYGGEAVDLGADIAVTPTGDVVLVGLTGSTTGIATAGSHQQTKGSSYLDNDGFVAVFTDSGIRRWGTYYSGAGFDRDYCSGVAVMNTGDIVIVGGTQSPTGIATTGSHQPVHSGNEDGFVAVFTNTGIRRWGTYYGGPASDVAVTQAGDIVLTGNTASKTGIATTGAHQSVNGGGGINGDAWIDAYLAVFTDAGVRRWGTYYGGDGRDQGRAVAVTPTNDIVLVGLAGSDTGIATAGTYQQTRAGSEDAFVAMFTDLGVRRWGTYHGGTLFDPDTDETVVAAAVTPSGDIVIASSTESSTGIASAGAYQETLSSGSRDAFVALFSNAGERRWGTYYGGTRTDVGVAVAVTPTGDIVLAGNTESMASIATVGTHQRTFNGGGYDAFVASFRVVPCVRPSVTLTSAVAVNEICLEQVTTLTASAGSGTRMRWTQPQRGTIMSSVTDTTVSVRWMSVGVDTVRVRVMRTTDSTCFRDTMIVVTVNALPTPVISSATGFAMCAGDSVTLDAGAGYANHTWFEGTTPMGTGRYLTTKIAASYTVRVSDGACSGTSASVTTTVNPLPTAGISETPPGTLAATTDATPASYQWYDASTDPWTSLTGATSSTYVPSSSGRYGVEVTNTATGCRSRSSAINITPPLANPVLTLLTPTVTVCQGDNVTLRVRVVGGRAPYGYQWSAGAAALSSTDTTATWRPAASTAVTCIVTDADGKRDTATMTVTVKPRPIAAIAETPVGILTAQPSDADSYQWLDASRASVAGAASAVFRPRTSGTYYVVVTQQGCVDTSEAATFTAPPNSGLEVSDYSFGSVPIDGLISISGGHVGSVRVQNRTGGYLELTGATTDDPLTFVVPQQWPRRLNDGDTAEIAVRFNPMEPRPYGTVISVATSTSITGIATISGTGRALLPDERVTQVVLRPSRTEVDPGDTISVNLVVITERPQATVGQAGRFISTVQWDNRVLEPVLTPGMDYDTTGTYAVASVLDGMRQQNQMQLYTFRFRAKQGEVDTTTILFRGATGFTWQDDRKSYAALLDSVIRVRVCQDGGPQLIGRSLPPSIITMTPHPAKDEVVVTYTTTDDGVLELVAADGKVVATVPARSNVSSAHFDLSNLSAGIYTVILRASGGSTHQSIVVIP